MKNYTISDVDDCSVRMTAHAIEFLGNDLSNNRVPSFLLGFNNTHRVDQNYTTSNHFLASDETGDPCLSLYREVLQTKEWTWHKENKITKAGYK